MANQHQPDAEAILGGAGERLASLVARTTDLLDLTDKSFALAGAGGLLVRSKHVRDGLQSWLQKFNIDCKLTAVEQPLEGCVGLAAPEFDGSLVKWHPT
jgi:hypothetical protein